MRNICKIFMTDVRRISKNVVAVVVIMGLSILPSLYAWFNIFSNWDPYGPDATSNLKVAVVSEDKGTTVAGITINIGTSVTEALGSNNIIGWVFSGSADEAVEGVHSGAYYAALVIPEDFTDEIISFMGGKVEHPKIIYYENEKKNAIAPKITQKARTAVQEQVNSTFVSTLAENIMKVGGRFAGTEGEDGSVTDTVLERLNDLNADMQSYVNLLNSFVGIMDSAQSIVSTSGAILPNLDSMVDSGQASILGMEGLLIGADGTADTAADMIGYSFDIVAGSLDSVANSIAGSLNPVGNFEQSVGNAVTAAQSTMPYLQKMFDLAVSGWENSGIEPVQDQIVLIREQFKVINTDLETLAGSVTAAAGDVNTLAARISTEVNNCKNALQALKDSFHNTVKPQLDAAMNSMQSSMLSSAMILNGSDADFGAVEKVLEKYQETLEKGSASIRESLVMARDLQQGIAALTADFLALSRDEQYKEVMEILESSPELLGSFLSSPVNLDTVGIYEIENYGSAMAPFYTILALWVGALILVAIIHVKVKPVEGLINVRPYQEYFGRYLLFFLIGQVQTLITILGDLFYIRIQCHNPFLFWLAGAVSSLVFTLFIYSLTVAFGNVGEALAIVVMVIQVAGAGGTFPIEVLPDIYQYVYKYLPFPYGMNAMRETVGGIYALDYWKYIGALSVYLVISLFIGLVLAVPFRKLNHMIEESKEKSGVMI